MSLTRGFVFWGGPGESDLGWSGESFWGGSGDWLLPCELQSELPWELRVNENRIGFSSFWGVPGSSIWGGLGSRFGGGPGIGFGGAWGRLFIELEL